MQDVNICRQVSQMFRAFCKDAKYWIPVLQREAKVCVHDHLHAIGVVLTHTHYTLPNSDEI